jgi:hypothetical protein
MIVGVSGMTACFSIMSRVRGLGEAMNATDEVSDTEFGHRGGRCVEIEEDYTRSGGRI